MRTLFFAIITILTSGCFSQNDILGDYVQSHSSDDSFIKVTLKNDSTFEYYSYFSIDHADRKGKWTIRMDTIIFYDYRSVIRTPFNKYKKSVIMDKKLIPLDSLGQLSKSGHLIKSDVAGTCLNIPVWRLLPITAPTSNWRG
jgi:hypothetical protein